MQRVADIVVQTLSNHGIDTCFSVVGGGAMHLNNAFINNKKIKMIYNHHEQACTMAAEGYARLSGKIAAVCVTSGPGGTNAINGVQGAWVDSLPMIVISGHPRLDTTVAVTGLDIRTRGVQENNIIDQVKYITKYAVQVKQPNMIKYELEKALDIAMDGRRGPVWVDVPLDIQGYQVEEDDLIIYSCKRLVAEATKKEINIFNQWLQLAKRPCILTGSGIRTSNVLKEFKEFCKKVQIPIVGGALQADINYNGENLYFGMSGTMGPRCGNFILQNADLILVLGNSLSTKQTGFNQKEFAKNAKVVMVDIQEDEAKKPGLHIDLLLHLNLKNFFEKYIRQNEVIESDKKWVDYCKMVYRELPKYEMLEENEPFNCTERVPALLFWKTFLESLPENGIVALGNSSCVHGALQYGVNYPSQRILVNYNCGSMGDDLPEAIGAARATNNETVYCVTGDGSIMMNLQEFQTIVYNKLPIKTIIFNNEGYGAIRTTCDNFFKGEKAGCDIESGISFPDFGKVANAFDINYYRVENIGQLNSGIQWLYAQKSYCILEIYQRLDDIKGPKVASKMDENGVFYTPGLEKMEPVISQELYTKLMKIGEE